MLIHDPGGAENNRRHVNETELYALLMDEVRRLKRAADLCDWREIETVSGRINRWTKQRRRNKGLS